MAAKAATSPASSRSGQISSLKQLELPPPLYDPYCDDPDCCKPLGAFTRLITLDEALRYGYGTEIYKLHPGLPPHTPHVRLLEHFHPSLTFWGKAGGLPSNRTNRLGSCGERDI